MIGSDLLFSRKAVYHCSFEIVVCHADAIIRESRCCCNTGFVGNVTCDTFTIKWALRGPYFGNCTFSGSRQPHCIHFEDNLSAEGIIIGSDIPASRKGVYLFIYFLIYQS